jgi:hypothetical protein
LQKQQKAKVLEIQSSCLKTRSKVPSKTHQRRQNRKTKKSSEPKPKVPFEIKNWTTLVMTLLSINPTQYTLDFTLVRELLG